MRMVQISDRSPDWAWPALRLFYFLTASALSSRQISRTLRAGTLIYLLLISTALVWNRSPITLRSMDFPCFRMTERSWSLPRIATPKSHATRTYLLPIGSNEPGQARAQLPGLRSEERRGGTER